MPRERGHPLPTRARVHTHLVVIHEVITEHAQGLSELSQLLVLRVEGRIGANAAVPPPQRAHNAHLSRDCSRLVL